MRTKFSIVLCTLCLMLVVGCGEQGPTGPEGPTGPQGVAGTGNLTTYSFALVPGFVAATFINRSCPALNVSQSIVSCYLLEVGGTDYITLPATVVEGDATTTKWTYKFKNGLVDIEYENSASTIPGDVTVYVNVINP